MGFCEFEYCGYCCASSALADGFGKFAFFFLHLRIHGFCLVKGFPGTVFLMDKVTS